MRRTIWDQGASRLKRFLLLLSFAAAFGVERPPIVGIANFVVKTDNLEDARRFYAGTLGYDEVFRHRRHGKTRRGGDGKKDGLVQKGTRRAPAPRPPQPHRGARHRVVGRGGEATRGARGGRARWQHAPGR